MALYISTLSSHHRTAHRSVGTFVDNSERDRHTNRRNSGPYQFEVLLFRERIKSEKDLVASCDALLTTSDTREPLWEESDCSISSMIFFVP
jgi:hypothetical protein